MTNKESSICIRLGTVGLVFFLFLASNCERSAKIDELTASFVYSPASPKLGEMVQFTDTSTGAPSSWQWSFNDGSTSTEQNPSHIFSTVKSYDVTLTVTNVTGSASTTRTISLSQILPDDRRIDWVAGISGGIPYYPVSINVKNAPYNAKGDGISDDTAAIKLAVANCPAGTAIYLPEGTYRLTSVILIDRKSIVLRGDGPDKTRLKNVATNNDAIVLQGVSSASKADVLSGYSKGSTSIVVSTASSFRIGNYIMISQVNDPSVCEEMPDYCPRAISQIVRITAISGNTITINRPLYYTYSSFFDPEIEKVDMIEKAGVEDLYIERVNNGSWSSSVLLDMAADCWVKNIESYNAVGNHVATQRAYGCEIRDSYMHHGHAYTSGRAYGVWLFDRSTDNLVENNIFYYLRHFVSFEYGGCGNVIGYNYCDRLFGDDYPNTDYLTEGIHTHGGHPYMNLIEGNICPHIVFDNALGSSRHNTAFRNHATRYSEGEAEPVIYNLNAIEVQMNNLYENVIGNVLCRPGDTGVMECACMERGVWRFGADQADCSPIDSRAKSTLLRHGNFDYVSGTTSWDPEITDRNLPKSLYLTSSPAFFGALAWPSIGPDLSPMVGEILAKLKFDSLNKLPN